MKYISILLLTLVSLQVFAQENKKSYETKFVENAPIIDGILDDEAWQNAAIATDFVMFKPERGTPEPKNLKTTVKIVYDHEAIYFGAFLHDDKPNEIPMEFQTRDHFGNADFFGIVLNPQNDGINQTEFFVMSTGNQNDAKVLPDGNEDWSWDAVWYSEVTVVENGWIVEVKIPYSALRFSNESIQTWSMNFHRRHQKTNEQYSWNFIPLDKGNIGLFDGLLTGIQNINPPVRLSFSPYVSASATKLESDYNSGWSAGMDLKYGISESFTLDATLIPDFKQVAFDNLVLNLGPYEHKYDEKRQFFTEGLDLFSKGDFFYTRRVGNAPIGRNDIELSDDETITSNPNTVNMLNAIKVSGRTNNGLGIGAFNAVTNRTRAQITNSVTGINRKVITEPFANYNVFVLDQQFNKNSSVTFINTNVLRAGHYRDANVTGLLFDVKTKNSKYGVSGGLAMSNINNNSSITSGFEGMFEAGKVSGNHQFDAQISFIDKDYDKNDLGYQRRNNYMSLQSSYSYRIFEPKGSFNNFGFYLWGNSGFLNQIEESYASYQEKSNAYIGTSIGISAWATTKKQLSFGANINTDLGKQYDYYEAQTIGRFFTENPNIGMNSWISTDRRKPFSGMFSAYFGTMLDDPKQYYSVSISPKYRVNNYFSIYYKIDFQEGENTKGFVTHLDDAIIFGNRNTKTIENSFSFNYNFDVKSSLELIARHYWSAVDYDSNFYELLLDGSLQNHSYTNNHDINYNVWNVDLNYAWEFAPGSQLSVLYRNSINTGGRETDLSFLSNFEHMIRKPLTNQLSFKLIYYLDYNEIKTWL